MSAEPFTPGNVAVYRVGEGWNLAAPSGNLVFIDEYTPSGTLVQVIQMPQWSWGADRAFLANGIASSEGALTRSSDEHFLMLAGYDSTFSVPDVTASSSATVNRVIGRVDWRGGVDTSTALSDFADGGSPRGVASVDGTAVWVSGSTGGIRRAAWGTQGTSTSIASSPPNLRNLLIAGGQLYAATGAGTAAQRKVSAVGLGLPTGSGQTITTLNGLPDSGSPYGFQLLDLDAATAGMDTLYVADDSIGLSKYSLVGGTWLSKGTIGGPNDDYRGLTASASGSTVTVFATRLGGTTAEGGGELVKVVDASGFNQPLSATPVLLATAEPNTAFRGVAFVPIGGPDLDIAISAPSTATVGVPFDYTITVRNISPSPVEGAYPVEVYFRKPDSLTMTGWFVAGEGGFMGEDLGNDVYFGSTAPMPGNSSVTLKVTFVATEPGNYSTMWGDPVVDYWEGIEEVNESNNSVQMSRTTLVSNEPLEDLRHRWSFATTADSVGGANLTLQGSANLSGGYLELPGSATPRTNYASVPIGGTIASLESMTVEAWFTMDVLTNWSKVWMFGTPNGGLQTALSYAALTPRANIFPRVDFDSPFSFERNTGAGANPGPLASGTQYHVVSVYDGPANQMRLYVSGVLVDSGPMGREVISQLGNTVQNFIGAAVYWPDPDLDGRVNELRIWSRPLTGTEISQSRTVGPDTLPNFQATVPRLLVQPVGSRNIVSGDSLTLSVVAEGNPQPSYQWYRGVAGESFDGIEGANEATFTSPALASSTNYWVRVYNAVGSVSSQTVHVGVSPIPTSGPRHRWSFSDATDSAGGANVTLVGNATISGGQLELPGGGAPRTNYASVPIGSTIASLYGMTVETWFTLDNIATWSKLWDFTKAVTQVQPGDTGVYFCPRHGSGFSQMSLDTAFGSSLVTSSLTPLATGVQYHLVSVYDPMNNEMRFYINGVLADVASMAGGNIGQVGNTVHNFIGAETYYNDPDIDGRVNEMRIWDRPLSQAEIARNRTAGPDQLLVTPGFTTHPASPTIFSGQTATLSVTATGTPAPTFQWYRGESGDTSDPISGATSSSFTTSALTTTTHYWVQATNAAGSTGSGTSTVTVQHRPDLTVDVTAPATALTADGFTYVVTARNAGLGVADPLRLRFTVPQGLTIQALLGIPTGFLLEENGNELELIGIFPVEPGAEIIFEVQVSGPVGTYTAAAGAAVVDPDPLETNQGNNSSVSVQTIVTLSAVAPAIVTHPSSQIISSGTTASLSVVASGVPAPGFQWYRGESGNTTFPIDGATSASFTTPELTSTGRYWVRATNASGSRDSNAAVIKVQAAAAGTVAFNFYNEYYPEGTGISEGDNTARLNAAANLISPVWSNVAVTGNSVSVTGRGTGGFGSMAVSAYSSLQYHAGSESAGADGDASQQVFRVYLDDGDGGNGFFAGDGVGASIHVSGIQEFLQGFPGASAYRVTVFFNSDSASNSFPAAQIRQGVPGAPGAAAITSLPLLGNTNVVMLGNGLQPNPAAGSSSSGMLGTRAWGELGGLTADSITITMPSRTLQVRASVAGFAITPLILAAPEIVVQPDDQIIASGGNATLTVGATGSPAPSYQWYQGSSGNTSVPIPGATSPSFTTPALTANTRYWVRVSNSAGDADSGTVTVRMDLLVNGSFELPEIEELLSVHAPNNTTMIGWTVSQGDIEIVRPVYWPGADGVQSLDVSGVSAGTIYQDVTGLIPGATYRLEFALAGNPYADGEPIKLLRVTAGSVTQDFEFDVTPYHIGGGSAVDMGWSFQSVEFVATSETERIKFQSLNQSTRGPALDDVTLVKIADPAAVAPSFVSQPGVGGVVQSGGTVTMSVVVSGNPAPTCQWYRGSSGDTSDPIDGATPDSFTTPIWATTSFWVRASNVAGFVDSNTVTFTVLSPNADLADLATGDGTLTPAFDPNVFEYTVAVPFRTVSVGIRATTAHPAATVGFAQAWLPVLQSGVFSFPMSLEVGENTFIVRNWSEDGTVFKDYLLRITRAEESADPVYRYDFNSAGVLPNLTAVNGTGSPLGERMMVENGVLRQRTSVVTGDVMFTFPNAGQSNGGFSAAKASFAEARLQVGDLSGRGGVFFEMADGAYRYPLSFAPGGVYVGTTGGESERFVPLDLSGFHTYRLESPANSGALFFYYDGVLVFATTGTTSTLNGFSWGDASGLGGDHGNADWDYIVFSQSSSYTPPSSNAQLAGLTLGTGTLSPSFSAGVLSYQASVVNGVTAITVTPVAADAGAKVKVNGVPVTSGSPSAPVSLSVGTNVIPIVVTSADLSSTVSYAVTVDRGPPMIVTTGAANSVSSSGATLDGTVQPQGNALAFFEYGTTDSYGRQTAAQGVSGNGTVAVEMSLSGLVPGTTYYYRLVARNGPSTVVGAGQTFATLPAAPAVITGNPVGVTTAQATLIGAVDGRGLEASVHFQFGLTTLYGGTTPVETVPAGTGVKDVVATATGLVPNATYHYRLVATTASGTSYGEDVTFVATATGGNPEVTPPTAAPVVTTGAVADVSTTEAEILGTVNPKSGLTFVYFQYGTTTAYGSTTNDPSFNIGNVTTDVAVSLPAMRLYPGTLYHYRMVATNSLGTTYGEDRTFRTSYLPPAVTTAGVRFLSTTSVQVEGVVRANDSATNIVIEYGTNPASLDRTIDTTPATLTGNSHTTVIAVLDELAQGTSYYYRVTAVNDGGTSHGEIRRFDVSILSGLDRRFPDGIVALDHSGSLTVTLAPEGLGGGWRFAGETGWRAAGATANGLTSGDRIIEFRPVAGHLQPLSESIAVASGAGPLSISRTYTPTGAPGSGEVLIVLKPDSISSTDLPVESRAQWRFAGEPDSAWRDSGTEVSGLVPGDHLIECKPVPGRSTPSAVTAVVADGDTTFGTITYFIAANPVGAGPAVLSYSTVTTDEGRPFAFAGQILSDAGAGTGFVVKPSVVATAGHVLFDDGTLAATSGVRWLFQRDAGTHEPVPVEPRGFYLMTGYATRRALDNSPGISSPQSQNLDAAAMYFSGNISRQGYSGFLASDATVNEFVVSSLDKTIIGYPVEGTFPFVGRMHSTPVAPVSFSSAFGQTYVTTAIRSSGGNSGGPLCVRNPNGIWYPAAIFLGGSAQTVVRAIDSDVTDLFGFAETSAGTAAGETGGSGVIGEFEATGTPGFGAIRVNIEPAGARVAGARWRINSGDPYQTSGSQIGGLNPNTYTVQLSTVPGFLPPPPQPLVVTGGQLVPLTFTYEEIISPPVITSSSSVAVVRGQPLSYQIVATNSPESFNMLGNLPAGVSFDAGLGRISGTPQEAGVFQVTVSATNTGGADSRLVTISSLPVLASQALTIPWEQPMSYQLVGSESGPGVIWSASNLPNGLALNPATGLVSGTPIVAGEFDVPVSLAKNGATSTRTLTLTITGAAPVFTLQPPASRQIEFGTGTFFTVAASGTPAPGYKWYRGESGDTSQEVGSFATFSTPLLTTSARYWVKATSISGSANSSSVLITLTPSKNPNLTYLYPSAGQLAPSFHPATANYQVTVPNSVPAISLMAGVQVSQTTLRVNGQVVAADQMSQVIPLEVGVNSITVSGTAGDGVSQRNHVVTVTRAEPPVAITGTATGVGHATATLNGLVDPNGEVSYHFQYGTTTAYGIQTAPQPASGNDQTPVHTAIDGLKGSTLYHYRIAVVTPAGTIFGGDSTFTTAAEPPLVVTGMPAGVGASQAVFTGAVNPMGSNVTLHFEYGLSPLLGSEESVAAPNPNGGTSVKDVTKPMTGLEANATYFYRLVATSSAGTTRGEIVSFKLGTGSGTGDGIADSAPTVTTVEAADETTGSAVLQGAVFPNDGSTLAWFEYGTTTAYGSETTPEGIGNGSDQANVTQSVSGLLPATEYHFRIVAENAKGRSYGADLTFITVFNPPVATTGVVEGVTASSVRVHGTVRARGTGATVRVEYGTDGITFPESALIHEGLITGDSETPVSADLIGLDPAVRYHARLRADSSGGIGRGAIITFYPGALMGLVQSPPQATPTSERSGQLTVNLTPSGGGWRFQGETRWRASGTAASGLTTGDRVVEFQPVAGYIQPPPENVGIVSGEAAVVLERMYYVSGSPGGASLAVHLLPSEISSTGLPVSNRAQWRFAGIAGDPWRDSGASVAGLMPGSYLIECKAVSGYQPAGARSVVVAGAEARSISMSYFPSSSPNLNPPAAVSFDAAGLNPQLPYTHVGQIHSDAGSFSGFAVKRRVVATAAQAVFDESTLTVTGGIQWMHRRDQGNHEPDPMQPRGLYIFDGYASRRATENTPGILSAESRNANVAALYFMEDAAKGGFSGFIASDTPGTSPLLSSPLKTLAGYPVAGIAPANQGRLHVTTPSASAYALLTGFTFDSAAIRGSGGMEGGPLAVRGDGGVYYPAGIYVGGVNRGAVRVFDAGVIDLFSRAEISGNGGGNSTGGGITHTSLASLGTTDNLGSIEVKLVDPAGNPVSGAFWGLAPEVPERNSGARLGGKPVGTYVIAIKQITGYAPPSSPTVTVYANQRTTITYQYSLPLSAAQSWRQLHFGSTDNTGIAADAADPDGDGRPNIDEYTAGTNPKQGGDFLKVLSSTRSGTTFTATVGGKAGRVYHLQRRASLSSGNWTTVRSSSVLASDGMVPLSDTESPDGRAFYRVVVVLP